MDRSPVAARIRHRTGRNRGKVSVHYTIRGVSAFPMEHQSTGFLISLQHQNKYQMFPNIDCRLQKMKRFRVLLNRCGSRG